MKFPKLTTPAWIAGQSVAVKILGGLVVVLFIAVAIFAWRLRAAHAETERLALERSNAVARETPSRALTEAELAAIRSVVKEEVTGATRPIVQAPQRNDALDRALAQDRAVLTALTASIAALAAHTTSTSAVTTDSSDARKASFDVTQPPYTVHADVTLPRPPGHGVLDVGVELEPAHLMPRIGCGKADANGIRPALTTVIGPPWLTIVIDSGSQDPAICNPQLAKRPSCFKPRLAVGPGYSVQIDPSTHEARGGWSLNATVSLWTADLGLNLFRLRCQ
jgi:hypothetical protein